MAGQSIAFFFRHILKCPYTIPGFVYPRKTTKLPPVMSPEEVKNLINSIQNVKHRTIVMMLYSTGMRLAEIAALKITDIDSKNMRIKVVQGKGAKDRFTLLSQQVLVELRAYYLIYRPQEFLFNGYTKGKAMSKRMIQHIVHNTLDKMGFANKNYSVHTIRHSFATHLIENGTDLHTIKELLGHTDLQTTSRYLHFTTTRISQVTNPYDALDKTDQQQQ
jgi:integrase/recombinase XerD